MVINEIFYHAPDDISQLQWIELHNTGTASVDVSGWKLKDGLKFEFPANSSIPAEGYLVLCEDARRFAEYYKVTASGEFKKTLKHSGESIELVDKNGKRVDRVTFSNKAPWPIAPDGYSASLERITPSADGMLPSNWAPSALSAELTVPGGSPGARNSTFALQLPPVIAEVTFTPAPPSPTDPIRVTARLGEKSEAKAVELHFQTVRSTNVSSETVIAMKASGTKYEAEIPPQADGTLLRLSVRASNAQGAERSYPPKNELRPALSVYVQSTPEVGAIPLAYVMNTDPRDAADSVRYIERARHGNGNPFSDEGAGRLRRMIEPGLDLEAAWFELSASRSFDQKTYEALQQVFVHYIGERQKLLDDTTLYRADDKEILDRIAAKRKAFADDTLKVLPENDRAALTSRLNSANNPEGPDGFFKYLLKIEGGWLALNEKFVLTEAQRKTLQPVLVKAVEGRSLKNPALKDLEPGPGSFPKMQEVFGNVEKEMWAQLRTALSYPQVRYLQRWYRDNGSFIRPKSSEVRPVAARGSSAFVVIDPKTKKPEVFDFVNVTERSAGYKVRFHKDHTFRGMNVADIIFEYNDRFVLAEPLAYELYRKVGCPSPVEDFVRLNLNGQTIGYHLLFEQINKSFLRRNGRNPDGDLFKLAWYGRSIESQHEKQTNPDGNHDALVSLVNQLNSTKGQEQWAVIEKNFNVPEVINYFAVNMCLSHWDGFFNNYFAYHDKQGTGKWEMYAWDQDKTWGFYDNIKAGDVFFDMPLTFGMEGDLPPGGGPARFDPNSWWRPGGFFSKPLLANPEFRKRFLKRLNEILAKDFTADEMFPIMDQMAARLRPEVPIRAKALNRSPDEALKRLDENIASLKENLRKRREFLLNQSELKLAENVR